MINHKNIITLRKDLIPHIASIHARWVVSSINNWINIIFIFELMGLIHVFDLT